MVLQMLVVPKKVAREVFTVKSIYQNIDKKIDAITCAT